METYRTQSFRNFEPELRPDGTRSPIVAVDVPALRRIQRGTMHHYWRGVMCNKNPFRQAIYNRLVWDLKPATIIEVGYKFGGGALWFADQSQAMGLDTRLYCIDVEQREEVEDDPRRGSEPGAPRVRRGAPVDLRARRGVLRLLRQQHHLVHQRLAAPDRRPWTG